jgi:N-acyl homoserine lactone hydrolase
MSVAEQNTPSADGHATISEPRLYMFESGTLKCHVENIKMNQGLGEEYEIPVPWFLVAHPKGLVVIDGGNAAECAQDPRGHWGTSATCTGR